MLLPQRQLDDVRVRGGVDQSPHGPGERLVVVQVLEVLVACPQLTLQLEFLPIRLQRPKSSWDHLLKEILCLPRSNNRLLGLSSFYNE